MKADLTSLTKTVEASRADLLADYDPETLHVLRVAIRRLRTHLDAVADKGARKQRERWAKIVARTNDARDWDVLWRDLRAELSTPDFRTISPALKERRNKARGRVLSLLDSRDWDNTITWWHRYLGELESHSRRETLALPMGKVEHRLAKASHKALTRGDEKDWHKLRIAAKALRYTLDERMQTLGDDKRLASRMSWCKQLQETLGQWHDCVVERGLLEELQQQLGRHEERPALTVVAALLNRVEARRQACLSEAQALLETPTGQRATG
jgi:CHAD domain-containing protein